jgi:histidine triad (HIT) family protein
MNETIFTKIINGDIPSHKIYEDEKTFAFLDIHPVTEGHVLVIPKNPTEFIWDLPSEDYTALLQAAHKLGAHIREKLETPHVGMLVEGLGVPHAHVHLIPFTHGHEMRREADMSIEPDHQALAIIAERIRL